MRLRNSVKALIIEDGRILFTKHSDAMGGAEFYGLPGGGQNPGETFIQTVQRECLEELGAQVEPSELVLIREYIGMNHEFAHMHADVHQIEYVFACSLITPVDLSRATEMDSNQAGIEWIAINDIQTMNVYPKALRTAFDAQGKIKPPIYLGDVN